jgi:uncharacterized protein YgfB (UPF0149 family)
MPSPADYEAVARALDACASTVHPSEAHGCLCGALCVRVGYAPQAWYEELLPDAAEAGAGAQTGDGPARAAAAVPVLAELYETTVGALRRPDLEFAPLLPPDEAALESRVAALAAWCAGFLYGFGAAGAPERAALPESVEEVLVDLARLSQAGDTGSDESEVEEAAYAELVEFLRAAVQLVYEDLDALRDLQRGADPTHPGNP